MSLCATGVTLWNKGLNEKKSFDFLLSQVHKSKEKKKKSWFSSDFTKNQPISGNIFFS